MKYVDGEQRAEPPGSGAIESTCRQQQCRMKRCGQFWSTSGDEALLDLETCWRKERWDLLFPHAKLTSASQNRASLQPRSPDHSINPASVWTLSPRKP